MHVIIDDFGWIAIGLAVITVLFLICVAFILLDEGLAILFRKARQWRTETPGGDKRVSKGALAKVLTPAWRAIQAKLRTATDGTHMPFRLGHR